MKYYGSLNNRLEENQMFVDEIKVGDYATIYYYSDSHAYEVIEVKDQKHVTIRRLKAIRIDDNGMSDAQIYKYESDPNGHVMNLSFRHGAWRHQVQAWFETKPHWAKENISFGIASEYFDYSF